MKKHILGGLLALILVSILWVSYGVFAATQEQPDALLMDTVDHTYADRLETEVITLYSMTGSPPFTFTELDFPPSMNAVWLSPTHIQITPDYDGVERLAVQVEDSTGATAVYYRYVSTLLGVQVHEYLFSVLEGVPFSYYPSASGGTPPYTFAPTGVVGGTLDASSLPYIYTSTSASIGGIWMEVTDAHGYTDTGYVHFFINDSFEIESQVYQVDANTTQLVELVISNAGGNITYDATPPNNGVITGALPNFTYTPNMNFIGVDTVTVNATDQSGKQVTALITFEVGSPLDETPLELVTTGETEVTFPLNDIGGILPLSHNIVTPPANGILTETDGVFAYLPNVGFSGVESIVIEVYDSAGNVVQVTVSITVTPLLDIPDGNIAALITAIEIANTSELPYRIRLAENGIYEFTTRYGDPTDYTGLPIITGNITMEGRNATFIRHDSETAMRFLYITGVADISDANFVGGYSTYGGAIYSEGILTVNRSSFTENGAYNGGGAIATGLVNQLEIYDSIFNSNGSNSSGGALYLQGGASAISIIEDSIFMSNHSGTSYGGDAISNSTVLYLRGSVLRDNFSEARYHYGIYSHTHHLEITDVIIEVSDSDTTLLRLESSEKVTITRSAFIGGSSAISHSISSPNTENIHIDDNCFANQAYRAYSGSTGILNYLSGNWWGASDGPSGEGYTGGGVPLSALVSITNWLTEMPSHDGCISMLPQPVTQEIYLPQDSVGESFVITPLGGLAPYIFTVQTAPAMGTLSGSDTNWIYTPSTGLSGTDSVVFNMLDAAGNATTATVNLIIQPPLVDEVQQVITEQDFPLEFNLEPVTGLPPFTFDYTQPIYGELYGMEGEMVYVPPFGFTGIDTFTYTVTDALNTVRTNTVQIDVTPARPATIIVDSFDFESPYIENGNCTLSEAISAANQNVPKDACPAGSATETDIIQLPAGVFEIPGGEQLNNVGSNTIVRGAGMGNTRIEQNTHADYPLLTVTGTQVTLMNMTLTSRNSYASGAAINFAQNAQAEVYNIHFNENVTTRSGIIFGDRNTSLRFINNIFTDNASSVATIRRYESASYTLVYNVFVDNLPTSDYEVAILDGDVSQYNCVAFIDNVPHSSPQPGPALRGEYNFPYSPEAFDNPPSICDRVDLPSLDVPPINGEELERLVDYVSWLPGEQTITLLPENVYQIPSRLLFIITPTTLNGNGAIIEPAPGVETGLLVIDETVMVSNLTLRKGNGSDGGAVLIQIGNSVTLDHVNFINNTASRGAAVYAVRSSSVLITNARFEGNHSSGSGVVAGETITVTDSVFINNTTNNSDIGSDAGLNGHDQIIFRRNCFINSGLSVSSYYDLLSDIDAAENWWGASDGPSGSAPGSGVQIQGFTTYFPVLTSPPPQCADQLTSFVGSVSQVFTHGGLEVSTTIDAYYGTPPYNFTLMGQPANGVAALNGQTLTYTPNVEFVGKDLVQFEVTDNLGNITAGYMLVKVNAPLIAVDKNFTILRGDSITFYVNGSNGFPNVRVTGFSDPAQGELTVISANQVQYTSTGLSGEDSFTYTVTDAQGFQATGTITIEVGLPIDVSPQTLSVLQGTTINVSIEQSGGRPDYIQRIITPPTHGAAYIRGGKLVYASTPGYVGEDTLTLQVEDGNGETSDAVYTFNVYAPLSSPESLNGFTASISGADALLTWSPLDAGMTDAVIILERSRYVGDWVQIAELPFDTTSYTDAALFCDRSYRYRGYVVMNYQPSDYTPENLIDVVCSSFVLTLTSGNEVTLNWVEQAGATGYLLSRSIDGIHWEELTTTSDTSYLDTPTCEMTFYYRVKALGLELISNQRLVRMPTCAPETLSAMLLDPATIELEWLDNSNIEDSYIIERRLNDSDTWAEVATLPADTTTYVDADLICDTTYHYRVRGYDLVDGYSHYADFNQVIVESCSVDLLLAVTSDVAYIQVNEPITYTINAQNAGTDDARNVIIAADLPDNTLYGGGSSECMLLNSTLYCNLGTIRPQESRAVEIVLRPTDADDFALTLSVSTTSMDVEANNNQTTTHTRVVTGVVVMVNEQMLFNAIQNQINSETSTIQFVLADFVDTDQALFTVRLTDGTVAETWLSIDNTNGLMQIAITQIEVNGEPASQEVINAIYMELPSLLTGALDMLLVDAVEILDFTLSDSLLIFDVMR